MFYLKIAAIMVIVKLAFAVIPAHAYDDGLHDEEDYYEEYSYDEYEEESYEDDTEPTREFYMKHSGHPRDRGTCYMRDVDRAWYDDGIGMFSNGHEIACPD